MSYADWSASRDRVTDMEPLAPLWRPDSTKKKRVSGGKLTLGEEEFIEWFTTTRPVLEKFAQPAFEDAWTNILWYTGKYLPTIPLIVRTDSGAELRIPRQLAPLSINYVGFLTDKRTAELSIYKATHDCAPDDETNSSERQTANVIKRMLNRSKRLNQIDALLTENERITMISGFGYLGVDWNDKIGNKKGPRSDKREGQVEVRIRFPWHVLPWRSRSWREVPRLIEVYDILHVEEARVKYARPDLEPFGSKNLYTFESPFIETIAPDEVVVWRTIEKPSEFLPNGAVVLSTHDEVLSMEVDTYPWSHEEFPLERYSDLEVVSRFWPMSFYQRIKPMQHTYDNLSGLLKRYIHTLGHPKILHERGSVNTKALGNSPSLVGVKPSAKFVPSIMQVKSIGSDPFNFRSGLRDEMISFSDTHKIGLGDLPPNTRSSLMISRLREIENQQRGPQIDKKNDFAGRVLLKMASVDADHLPLSSDAHIARVVGKDLIADVKNLKNVKVSAQTRVLIVNSTGFSAELTGRVAEIASIETDAKLPLLPQEKRDIIGGVLREKQYDVMTAAKFTADAEIQMMDEGVRPPAARITDDLITHWTTLSINMQTMSHRRLPEKCRKLKEDRLLEIECLIEEVIQKNPTGLFVEKVKLLDGYPRLYNMTVEPGDQGGAGGTPNPQDQAAAQAKALQDMSPAASASPGQQVSQQPIGA